MDNFLTLFLAQLTNQDPTNPMESYELASQLAQFSTVEQLASLNEQVSALEDYLTALNNAEMINLVGKQVSATSDALQLKDGSVTGCSYTLDDAAADVTVKVYDESGVLVTSYSTGSQDAGTYSVDWDGTDSSGNTVEDGNYTCTVQATDSSGGTSTLTTTISGSVYSYVLEDSAGYLVLDNADGIRILPSAVTEVGTSSSAAAQAASAYSTGSSVLSSLFSTSA